MTLPTFKRNLKNSWSKRKILTEAYITLFIVPLSSSVHFLLLAVYGIMKIEHKISSCSHSLFNPYTNTCRVHVMLQKPVEALDFQKKLKVVEPPWCLFKFTYSWLQQTRVIAPKPVKVPARPDWKWHWHSISHRQMNSKCHCHSTL